MGPYDHIYERIDRFSADVSGLTAELRKVDRLITDDSTLVEAIDDMEAILDSWRQWKKARRITRDTLNKSAMMWHSKHKRPDTEWG